MRRAVAYGAVIACGMCAALPRAVAADPGVPFGLELPAGGLVFNGREKIVVDDEQLTLALDRVEITYRVRNSTSGPRTFVAAFQMPTIDMANLDGQSLAIPAFDPNNPTNFVGFWTTIDGATVEPDVDVRAFAVGQADVTAMLKQYELPLYPLMPGLSDRIAALPLDTRRALDAAELIDGDANPPQPLWALRTVFHWRKALAAETTTTIRHHYKPIAGSAPWSQELRDKVAAKYCLAADDVAALDKALQSGKAPIVYWVHYVPGNNAWLKGESAQHTLRVERPSGLRIAATCATGGRTSTGTGLEISTTRRVDDNDIMLLFAE